VGDVEGWGIPMCTSWGLDFGRA